MHEANETPEMTPTDTVQLGTTGLYVSPVGLGAWSWGDRRMWGYGKGYGESDVHAAFRASLQAGVNFFDTAEIYGQGESERLLGQFARDVERRLITVASKFLPLPWRGRRSTLLSALRASLERLGMPYVDLYQIHFPVPLVSNGVLMNGLADAVEQGLTRSVGVSNYNLARMRQARALLAARGVPLASNQVEYSLIQRGPERSGLLAACQDYGITLIAYSPLGKGLLTGKYGPQNPPPGVRGRMYRQGYLERMGPLLAALNEIGRSRGRTPAQVALNWTICKGALPIPGAKNAQQAEQNAGALGWRLDDGEVAELDRLSSGL